MYFAFRRNDIYLNSWHVIKCAAKSRSYWKFLAFSTASSIVPTM